MSAERYPIDACFEFGAYRLDLFEDALFRGGTLLPCGPQACRLLRALVSAAGELLSWDQLMNAAWGGPYVTKAAIHFQVHALRQLLEDDPEQPTFIETVRKQGLRFVAAVRKSGPTGASAALYEQGRHLYHKSTPQDIVKGIECFRAVIDRGREFVADAYAAIAESFVLLGTFAHQTMPASVAMAKAQEAATCALRIDNRIAEARSALGSIAALYDWNWPSAANHFREALGLPCNRLVKPTIRAWYSLCLAARGDSQLGREEIARARAEYPSSFVLAALSGRIAYLARDFKTAMKEHEDGVMLEDATFVSHMFKGHSERGAGEYDAAERSFLRAVELSGGNPVCLAEVGHIKALLGRTREAREILALIEERARTQYVAPHLLAHVNLGLGDIDNVFRFLDASYDDRCAYLIFLAVDPVYDPLRSDDRFKHLMARVGFSSCAS